jgi:hypothetical protein
MSKLTKTAIEKAKPGSKPIKKSDEGGLNLTILPSGAKCWRYTSGIFTTFSWRVRPCLYF